MNVIWSLGAGLAIGLWIGVIFFAGPQIGQHEARIDRLESLHPEVQEQKP